MGLTLECDWRFVPLGLTPSKPSLQLAKIHLVFSLESWSSIITVVPFANPNPWLNSIITTLSALFISFLEDYMKATSKPIAVILIRSGSRGLVDKISNR